MGDDDNVPGVQGGMGSAGAMAKPSFAEAAARRRAIRMTMKPGPTVKHGLIKAPHISHPRDNTGPSFGSANGGFKAGGF